MRPVSTTTMLPSYSTTVMFLPISPSPPSGRTRSRPELTAPWPPAVPGSCGRAARERAQEVVVARIQRERRLVDDAAGLVDVVVCLLDRGDVRDLRKLGEEVGLEVDHAASRNVVDHHGEVGRGGDRLEVAFEPAAA